MNVVGGECFQLFVCSYHILLWFFENV